MQCYHCGSSIPLAARTCPVCGQARSWLIYTRLCSAAGGLVGSFLGFSLYDVPGALVGGLAGIVVCEVAARFALRPHGKRAP
jgi:hypothetical protein